MAQPVAPVLVRWHTPHGDAPFAEQLSKVAIRHLRRARPSGGVSFWFALLAMSIGFGVLALISGWPGMVPLLIGAATLGLLMAIAPSRTAKMWRNQPTFFEAYTITVDADGLHVVGPSTATHQRWRVYDTVAIDEDVLVLGLRGVKYVRVFPLAALDPAVDRSWLEGEVARLIAADTAAITTDVPRL